MAATLARGLIGVAVVARWYPSVHDPIAGRFVADQVRGLMHTGRVRAGVITFEPASLTGSPEERARQHAAVQRVAAAARADAQPFHDGGWGAPRGVPIARPTIPTGWLAARDEPAHAAADRRDALLALAEPLSARLPSRALVHAHTGYPDGNAAASLAQRLGAPLVVTEHSTFLADQLADPVRRRAVMEAFDAAARVVTVSETLANEVRTSLPEVAAKLRVIPNVVATEDFSLVDPRVRNDDELLFVGYLRPTKGIDLLLDAFARVRAVRPAARLRLVGRAPTRDEAQRWESQVEALRLGDAVEFAGATGRAGVVEAMQRASLLVHAGYRETFGVVAVEALATGLPVVATDSGGITEVLGPEPDRLGRLVRSREPDALAAAILDALDGRSRFDAHALRASVESRFDARAVAARIVDLYEEVLDEANPGFAGPLRAAAPRRPPRAHSLSSSSTAVVVVGLNHKSVAALLEPLPPDLLRRLTVVTASGKGVDALRRLGVAEVMPVDPDALYRAALARAGAAGPRPGPLARLVRLVRDPLGPLRRRRVRAQRARIFAAPTQLTILEAVRTARSATAPPLVAWLDGNDALALEPLLGNRDLRLAPGGIRWLADEHPPS